MFIISKTFSFEASHQLKQHDGKCARRHGHSYTLTVVLKARNLQSEFLDDGKTPNPKHNMIMDFGDIKKAVEPLWKNLLDHHDLNETLREKSPTAEFIAQFCFDFLKERIPLLDKVIIQETKGTEVIYDER